MKLTERMYAAVEEIWQGYYDHPFVSALGHGTLAKEKFQFYMIQDYRYLLEYAKVFALGIAKSKDEALMRRFAEMVHGTLCDEMSLHIAYMKRLGISNEQIRETKTALANQSYTSYMLDVAYRGDALDIMAAILACAWSYREIGKHVAKIAGASEHPLYGEWVESYSSASYDESTQRMIDLVDVLGEGITPEKEAAITEIFVNCSRYEAGFWDMAEQMQM